MHLVRTSSPASRESLSTRFKQYHTPHLQYVRSCVHQVFTVVTCSINYFAGGSSQCAVSDVHGHVGFAALESTCAVCQFLQHLGFQLAWTTIWHSVFLFFAGACRKMTGWLSKVRRTWQSRWGCCRPHEVSDQQCRQTTYWGKLLQASAEDRPLIFHDQQIHVYRGYALYFLGP